MNEVDKLLIERGYFLISEDQVERYTTKLLLLL